MAGLIPRSFIDDLLARVDIVDIVTSRVSMKKSGANYHGLCPFHKEKTPSFTVNEAKQFYHCFGCGAAGNALNFLVNFDNVTFPEAVAQLADLAGVPVPETEDQKTVSSRDELKPIYSVLNQAANYFHQQLLSHPHARIAQNYLQKRGFSKEVVRDFSIGFAPPGWNNLMNHIAKNNQPQNLEHLLSAGLIIASEKQSDHYYDRFRNRLMFPIRNRKGQVVGFGGRVLSDGEQPKYLNSPETLVFHKGDELYGLFESQQKIKNADHLIVVEGYTDVTMLHQFGLTGVVATLGTAITEAHIRKLFRYTHKIIFCFDGDSAGIEAAKKAMTRALALLEDGRHVSFLLLPNGEDPDSLIKKEGVSGFSYRVLNTSQSLDQFLINHLSTSINTETLDGKAQFAKEAEQYVQKLPHGYYKALVENEICRVTGLDKQDFRTADSNKMEIAENSTLFDRHSKQSYAYEKKARFSQASSIPKIEVPLVWQAMRIIVKHPELSRYCDVSKLKESNDADHQFLATLIQIITTSKMDSTDYILGQLSGDALGERLIEKLKKDPLFCDSSENSEEDLQRILERISSKIDDEKAKTLSEKERLRHVLLKKGKN